MGSGLRRGWYHLSAVLFLKPTEADFSNLYEETFSLYNFFDADLSKCDGFLGNTCYCLGTYFFRLETGASIFFSNEAECMEGNYSLLTVFILLILCF